MGKLPRKTCSVDGCEAPVHAKRLCNRHHRRVRLYGDPHANFARIAPPCAVPGCENQHDRHGYCGKHAMAFMKYGDPLASAPPKPRRRCSVDGCGRVHYCGSYCTMHYGRMRAHGTTTLPPKPPQVTRLCDVPSCDRPHSARGLCAMHARRQKLGKPLEPQPIPDLLGEQWKPVAGAVGRYEVSNLGRVKSLPRTDIRVGGVAVRNAGRLLNPSSAHGYLHVRLGIEATLKSKSKVHALVAAAFIGPRPDGYDINHKNGIKSDNRVENLEYVTRSENNKHAYRMGLKPLPRGAQGGRAVLTEHQALYAKRMKGRKLQRELADELGCAVGTIANIHSGRAWRHLD